MLQRLNISFVSVDRPGHGLSDPQPNRTLLGWADDIRQLADHLQIDQFYVEGWSAGGHTYDLWQLMELQISRVTSIAMGN
jgi:pimeloyl-ACP methyl ester carboxylesterase